MTMLVITQAGHIVTKLQRKSLDFVTITKKIREINVT